MIKKWALPLFSYNIDQMDYSIYAIYGFRYETSLDDLLAEHAEIVKCKTEFISERLSKKNSK
jgi:hypothetical protein